MKDFEGKVAVITGGGGGIGKALGVRFGQAGMKVVLADNDRSLLEETVDQLPRVKTSTRPASSPTSDCSSRSRPCATRPLAAYGAVHVVCNNAGIGAGSQAVLGAERQRLAVDLRRQRVRRRERDQRLRPGRTPSRTPKVMW